MHFSASIRPGSDIDRRWHGENRRSGMLENTFFTRVGSTYHADTIAPEHLDRLMIHPSIVVATHGAPVSAHSSPLAHPVGEAKTPEILKMPEPVKEPVVAVKVPEPIAVVKEPVAVVKEPVAVAPQFRPKPRPHPGKGGRR